MKSEKVLELQRRMHQFIVGKRVEVENIHITLSFLGERNEEEIKRIIERLRRLSSSSLKRDAILTRVKLIPNERYIRVVAIEVVGIDDLVDTIKKEIGGDVKPPHLTLFRVKEVRNREALLKLTEEEINEHIFVDKICLVKSTLTFDGPIYEIIESFELS